jgi:putative DNA primase/helicase
MKPELFEAYAFVSALAGSRGAPCTWQTFDDKGKDKALARVLHGPLAGLEETLVRLNDLGAGVFVTVNETNLKGRTKDDIERSAPCSSTPTSQSLAPFAFKPSFRVKTSPGKEHDYWNVNGDATREPEDREALEG